MRAEEASELSFKAVEEKDVTYLLGRIKEAALGGAFSCTFGLMGAGDINALRQRGYTVEDGWGSTTVRWSPPQPNLNQCVPCGPITGINYK